MSEKMLEKIIVITGKPGLFRMLSQTRTGVIATSLIDGKKTVTNPREQINVLTEIQIYGIRGEVPLEEVFNKIFVYVTDNGGGFSESLLDRIAEPYITTKENGTGLGLAIATKIMEDHNGEILLRNKKNGDAEVVLVFNKLD